jgi:tripartite-type tricarboxylate transporter receptor subunit TctC
MKQFALALLLAAAAAIPGLAQTQSTEPASAPPGESAPTAAPAPAPAPAPAWPPKTVHVIVPFAAGSTPDAVARIFADAIGRKYPDATFIIEDRPGASGNIGTDAIAKAAPDGATIGVSIGGPLAINTLLYAHLPYDPKKDIAPITQLVTQPSALVVNPNLNVDNLHDLIMLLKVNPGKYTYGSIGNGSLSHLAMEAIAEKAGGKMVHVPYPGSPQAMLAVLRGDVNMGMLPAASVVPQVKAGKLRMLAVSTANRSLYLPDVPTLKESGLDVEADAWVGLIGPGGLPKETVARINKDTVELLKSAPVRDKLAAQLMEPVGSAPDELRAKMNAEIARWAPVIKAAKVTAN